MRRISGILWFLHGGEREFAQEKLISTQFVDAVDKKTGKVFEYDIFSDMSAYRLARNIDVRLLK